MQKDLHRAMIAELRRRLAASVIRRHKVRFQCPTCSLLRHDMDAVHCKACGTLLNIPNDEG